MVYNAFEAYKITEKIRQGQKEVANRKRLEKIRRSLKEGEFYQESGVTINLGGGSETTTTRTYTKEGTKTETQTRSSGTPLPPPQPQQPQSTPQLKDNSRVILQQSESQRRQQPSFQKRAEAQKERQDKFFNSEGFKRVEKVSEYAGPKGSIRQKVAYGFLSSGVSTGGVLSMTAEKVYLTGEALIRPETRNEVFPELKRSAIQALEVYKQPETYISAALVALPTTASLTLAGKGGFGPTGAKFKATDITFESKTAGKTNIYKGLSFEYGKKVPNAVELIGLKKEFVKNYKKPFIEQKIISKSESVLNIEYPQKTLNYVTLGKPILKITNRAKSGRFQSFTKLPLDSEMPLTSVSRSNIIRYNLPKKTIVKYDVQTPEGMFKLPAPSQKQVDIVSNLARETAFTKSKSIGKKINYETKSLNPEGVKDVVSFGIKEKGYDYGSYAATQQLRSSIKTARGLPGDQDLMFPTKTSASLKPKIDTKLLPKLQKSGNIVSRESSGTLIESVVGGKKIHAVDIHAIDTPEVAPQSFLSYSLNQPKIKIRTSGLFSKKATFSRLSQEQLSKGASVLTARTTEKGQLFLGPQAHRIKDISDFGFWNEELLLSKGKPTKQLNDYRNFYSDTIKKASVTADVNSPMPSKSIGSSISPMVIPSMSKSPSPSPSPSLSPSKSPSKSPSPSPSPSLSPSKSPSKSPSPSPSPSLSPPKYPSFVFMPFKSKSPSFPKLRDFTAFNVKVKVGGKYKIIGTRLTESEAINVGKRYTDTNTSRTFKLFQSGTVKREKRGIVDFNRYRRSKRDPLAYVEKSKYAISTGGEILGLRRGKRGLF
jgi:hypothetical protein